MNVRRLSPFALVATLLACGCDRDDAEESMGEGQIETREPEYGSAPGRATTAEEEANTTANAQGAAGQNRNAEPEVPLTETQVVHVLVTLNDGEVSQGRIASKNAKSSAVRRFGTQMVREHNAANRKLAGLRTITPEDNPVSTQLKTQADEATRTMEGQQGEEFDRAYIALQVTQHQQALTLIEERLMPRVTDAKLRGIVEGMRDSVRKHLEHAQHLQSEAANPGADHREHTRTGTNPTDGTAARSPSGRASGASANGGAARSTGSGLGGSLNTAAAGTRNRGTGDRGSSLVGGSSIDEGTMGGRTPTTTQDRETAGGGVGTTTTTGSTGGAVTPSGAAPGGTPVGGTAGGGTGGM